MPTYCIYTLGCKVNQFESAGLGEALRAAGWSSVPEGSPAQLCIINTCTVTSKASMQARQQIRKVIRHHPSARIVVTGCYAETSPEEIRAIDGVDAVIGNRDKHRIPEAVMAAAAGKRLIVEDADPEGHAHAPLAHLPVTRFTGRTRPFLKIQDGCNTFCTYCIVPYARGRSRSLPLAAALDNLRALAANGYREVVLTGIHLGDYGKDLFPPAALVDLLRLADAPDMPERIRLSSIEPTEISDALLSVVVASDRFCRHFHIPLQSGDDAVLKRMHRPYSRALYGDIIGRIHERLPGAAIGADVLIGFPGEDDAAYEQTRVLIESLPVTYLHVFPFSPREGTPAARFSEVVPAAVVKRRCAEMRRIGTAKRLAFYRAHEGQSLPVIVESRRDPQTGNLRGLSENYVPVLFEGPDQLMAHIVSVRVIEVARRGQVRAVLDAVDRPQPSPYSP
ncbi:MAG: tRNA (N(6)-L-threonylcarbamoyladenosine(37)-C(2))-methylthiotransferase MtaB [Pseudomonadota bacterium]